MSSKPESVFITSVHKHLPSTTYSMKNNNPFTGGVADVWYSGAAGDMWIEYKWLPKQPKAAFVPNLSALQIRWLRERYNEGRNVAVIVGCPDGAVILKNLEWERENTFGPIFTRKEIALWISEETTQCHLSVA